MFKAKLELLGMKSLKIFVKNNIRILITAHNLEDQVETFL